MRRIHIFFMCACMHMDLQKAWIRYHEANAILKHYERHNVVGKSRIFAEADYFRAAASLWTLVLRRAAQCR